MADLTDYDYELPRELIAQQPLNRRSDARLLHLDRAKRLMGPDFWSYGMQKNAHVLEAFFDLHFRQGLSPRRVTVEETFHPATLEVYSL